MPADKKCVSQNSNEPSTNKKNNLKKSPAISVIMPTFQGEDVLHLMLDSLAKQTFYDFEVIVVIDGSTDASEVVINNYRSVFKKLIIIKQENLGILKARMIGVMNANGEYLYFVDHDDTLDNRCLEKLYQKAVVENADLVHCGFTETVNNVTKCSKGKINYDFFNLNTFALWSKLIKHDYFLSVIDPHKTPHVSYFDDSISLLLGIFTDKISLIEECLYHHHLSNRSLSVRFTPMFESDFKEVFNYLQLYLNEKRIFEIYRIPFTIYFFMVKKSVDEYGNTELKQTFHEFEEEVIEKQNNWLTGKLL